jgi:hypothetical protein
MLPVSVAPTAAISACCCAADVPLANVTMYGTNGTVGGVVVVAATVVVAAVVVVAAEVAEAVVVDGAVVVVELELVVAAVVAGALDVVVAALVAVDIVSVVEVSVDSDDPASVDVDEVSLEDELVLSVNGGTSPNAPETSSPSTKTIATPTRTRVGRRRGVRPLTRSSAAKVPDWLAALHSPRPNRSTRPHHIVCGFRVLSLVEGVASDLAWAEVEPSPADALIADSERLCRRVGRVGAERALVEDDSCYPREDEPVRVFSGRCR